MPRTIRRITTIVWRIALGAFLTLFALGVFASATGHLRALTVLSGSMQPKMPIGSIILDQPVAASQIRVGNIITYENPTGSLTSHRVIKVLAENGRLVAETKGDANNSPDPWRVDLAGKVWRVSAVVPLAGYLLASIRDLSTFRVLSIALPALLAIIWLLQIWGSDRKSHANVTEEAQA